MTLPNPSEAARELAHRLDGQGRLRQWPARFKYQRLAAAYLVAKFETQRVYSEAEVNAVLDNWTLFRDAAALRRTLVEEGLLERTADGSEYRVTPPGVPPA